MPWRRLLAYGAMIGPLSAEEDLQWLTLLHPKDPAELAKSLRSAAGVTRRPAAGQGGTIDAWLRNPSLASQIHVVSAEEFAQLTATDAATDAATGAEPPPAEPRPAV